MKLKSIISIILSTAIVLFSCVKNEPLINSYSVPATYEYTVTDSSAKARIIMMYGLQNYLSKAATAVIDSAIVDSIWNNDGNPFNNEIVPDFLYTAAILNNMTAVNIIGSVNGTDKDSLQGFADSVVINSEYYNIQGTSGIAGTQIASGGLKYLFNDAGVDYVAVCSNALLGPMVLNSISGQLVSSGTNAAQNWNLAYDYTGLPANYDPAITYTSGIKDRPLSIASYFSESGSINTGASVYQLFRTGRAAAAAGDTRVSGSSADAIKLYLDKTIALAAIANLDATKQGTDVAAKLHNLSEAYGLIYALKSRLSATTYLSNDSYWMLRDILKINFYTLIQDPSYTQINTARNIISTAFSL